MKRIGITGHQGLDLPTTTLIREAIREQLRAWGPVKGIGSLAEGADQVFAEEVLAQDGLLVAVIPSAHYERCFADRPGLGRYRRLRQRCSEVIELPFAEPAEDAYWAAGQKVVELSDRMLAVWDGEQSGGLGGTADVVAYARERGKAVTVVWPAGSSRE